MAYGQPSWIATALIGAEAAARVTQVHSRIVTYPNTAGPRGGIGGSAKTDFTITLLTVRGGDVLAFADTDFVGWAPHVKPADHWNRHSSEIIARLMVDAKFQVDWLAPVETCPHPMTRDDQTTDDQATNGPTQDGA